jgi:hypothetical protein
LLAKGGSSGALLVKNRKNLSAKSPEATKDALEEIQKSSFEDFIVNRQRKIKHHEIARKTSSYGGQSSVNVHRSSFSYHEADQEVNSTSNLEFRRTTKQKTAGERTAYGGFDQLNFQGLHSFGSASSAFAFRILLQRRDALLAILQETGNFIFERSFVGWGLERTSSPVSVKSAARTVSVSSAWPVRSRCARRSGFGRFVNSLLDGKSDLAVLIDIDHLYGNRIADLQMIVDVFHVIVGDLRNVNETRDTS